MCHFTFHCDSHISWRIFTALVKVKKNIKQLYTNHKQPLKKFSRRWKSVESTATSVGFDVKLGSPLAVTPRPSLFAQTNTQITTLINTIIDIS